MVNTYKKIVLLKGLESISDYQFKMVKSLLAKDLKLNKKTQEDCDRIRMADLMEEKFPSDSGVSRLIELFKDMSGLEDLAEMLKKEKSKVQRKSKGKEVAPGRNKQDEPNRAQSTPAKNKDLKPKKGKAKVIKAEDSERSQEQSKHPEPSRTGTHQTQGSSQTFVPPPPPSSSSFSTKQPAAVPSVSGVVEQGKASPQPPSLKAKENISTKMDDWERNLLSMRKIWLQKTSATSTDQTQAQAQPRAPPNTPPSIASSSTAKKPRMAILPREPSSVQGYQREPKEVMVLKVTPLFVYHGEKTMFHATVATEREFFRLKVFDVKLQATFTPNKIVILSEYFGHNAFLEIYSSSWVSPGHPERIMNIPATLRHNATATRKINSLPLLHPGTFVNGTFLVCKKRVRNECVYYEIQDNTGKMEVVVFGRLTHVDCEEGDKVKLICFELALSVDQWQLRSAIHSYMEVIKSRKGKIQFPSPDSNKDTSHQSSIPNHWMPGSAFN
ncbi:gamma-interferon-inducible protein 16 isoform 2-T2 [Thomomys bottae]